MSRAVVLTLVLAAAALAGCTAGNEGAQLPLDQASSQAQGQDPGSGRQSSGPGHNGSDGWRGDLRLEVDPKSGNAPLDVTIRYDIGSRDHSGGGNSTNSTGNATGNATGPGASGNGTGNATGNATAGLGNGTAGSRQDNVTWSLELWRMQPSEVAAEGNLTGNATRPSGNATGNATGNASGTASGNSTAGPGGNASSGAADPAGPGNLTVQINGTLADLPGVTVQRVNATGHYKVRFTVDYGNGTTANRTAVVHVRELQDGDPLGNETREFTGSFLASEPLLCLGSEEFEWLLNDTFGGHGASVRRLNATLASDGLLDDYTMTLVSPNGTELATGPAIDLAGPLDAGNYTLRVDSCVAADTSFTVTGVVDYVLAKGRR